MKNIKTILFDIDGTLLDSKELILLSYEHVLGDAGINIHRDDLNKILGKTMEQGYAHLLPGTDVEGFIQKHIAFGTKNTDLITPFPKAEEVIAELRERGFKLAAVTNRKKWPGRAALDSQFVPWFDYVVTASDVINPKPHPEPLLKALTYFNISPIDSMMVGDSDADIQAGKAAGVTTVGATYGMFGHSILDHNPDHVIHALHELLDLL